MLLGRAFELERVRRLIEDAREGHGGVLLVTGEPGVGKTALLNEVIPPFDGHRLIRVTGIEAEANLPYAALGEAVAPLLGRLKLLPEPQATAIEAALALRASPEQNVERFATCAAFLGLITEEARDGPLLIMIDDAQWLDSSSDECFAYTARRLAGSRVALLAASRTGTHGMLIDSESMKHLELEGLEIGDSRTLLRETAPDATPGVLETLVESAAGNPLALRELPAALSTDQRKGLSPIDRVPATTDPLKNAFEGRLDAMTVETRAATEVASAAFDRKLAPVVAAVRDLGIEADALERAEAAGVVTIGENEIRFTHPLLKAVAYENCAAPDRRRAHRGLAAHSEADARAWHLAAGMLSPDQEVAALLEDAGNGAIRRGAHSVAVDALHRAAEFTGDPAGRSRRLYRAALSAALAGDYDRCEALLEVSAQVDEPLLRALSRHALAVIRLSGGMVLAPDAHEQLSREAELVVEDHPEIAAVMFADAALLAGTSGQFAPGEVAVQRSRAVLPEGASALIGCMVGSMSAMTTAIRGRARESRAEFNHADRLLGEVDSNSPVIQSIVLGLHGRVCCGQERELQSQLDLLIDEAWEAGALGLLPYLLTVFMDAAYRIGDWDRCDPCSQAIELAEECAQKGILPLALVVSGRLRAARGQTDRAMDELERGTSLAENGGAHVVAAIGRGGIGFLELGIGRTEQAIEALERVGQFAVRSGLEDPVFIPWAPDLVEAYVRAGLTKDAERLTASLDLRAKKAAVPLSMAYAARCRGLVVESDFEQPFEDALAQHEQAKAPFETARTLMLYGQRLHRARRRVEGRERLRDAREIFESLGAKPWVEQTDVELTAAGAINRAQTGDPDALSPQEIRVARLVADGATNREVAARMYLSPKTIEFHLGRVYRKLDIHSRTELATLSAAGVLDQAEERISSSAQHQLP